MLQTVRISQSVWAALSSTLFCANQNKLGLNDMESAFKDGEVRKTAFNLWNMIAIKKFLFGD